MVPSATRHHVHYWGSPTCRTTCRWRFGSDSSGKATQQELDEDERTYQDVCRAQDAKPFKDDRTTKDQDYFGLNLLDMPSFIQSYKPNGGPPQQASNHTIFVANTCTSNSLNPAWMLLSIPIRARPQPNDNRWDETGPTSRRVEDASFAGMKVLKRKLEMKLLEVFIALVWWCSARAMNWDVFTPPEITGSVLNPITPLEIGQEVSQTKKIVGRKI